MGIKAALAVMAGKPGTPLDAARQAVADAESKVAAEAKRIAATEEEIRRISEEITSTDPDDVGADFAKLVRQRDTARGRIEALQVRAGSAARALDAAKEALKAAELDAKREEHERLAEEFHRRAGQLTADAKALHAKILVEREALRELQNKAAHLAGPLRDAGVPVDSLTSRWPDAWGWGSPLEKAARIVTEGGR